MSLLYSIRPAPRAAGELGRLHSLPILILNVHSRCNCRCVMCDIWKRTENIEMNAAELERHRESIRNLGVRHVVLTGGEPLMHSDLATLCNFFRHQDIQLTLLTTGLLLRKRAAIVAACFDNVIVSLDGPQMVHDHIRRVAGSFTLIGEGIAAVRELAPTLPICCRTTVQKANHHSLRATVRAAKELGLDSISFLSADVFSSAFNRAEPWSGERQDEVALTRAEISALEEEIELMVTVHAEDIRTRYIVEAPQKLRALPDRFRERLDGTRSRSPTCNAPWVSAAVDVDGAVRPCFFHLPFGSLRGTTLEEVVNSDAARSFRGSLNVAENPVCQSCVCSLNYREQDPPAAEAARLQINDIAMTAR